MIERKNELLEALKQDEAARRFLKHAIETKGGEEVEPLKDIRPDAITKLESFGLFVLIDHKHVLKDEVELEELQQILTEAVESKEVPTETKQLNLRAEAVRLNTELKAKFDEIARDNDPIEYFTKLIAPSIAGESYDEIKKAILIMLASNKDKDGVRRRVHVLLFGAPGTAKGEFLWYLYNNFDAHFIGAATSAVGLKGDSRGKEITPGELYYANDGVLALDEIEKVPNTDRQSLLEAMEEGKYKITKGSSDMFKFFAARVNVIAAGNNINGLSPELLDRFDFVFELEKPYGAERKQIASKVIDLFYFGRQGEATDADLINSYAEYVMNKPLERPVEERDRIQRLINEYIDRKSDIEQHTIRNLEASIMRVGEAIARLKQEPLRAEHVLEAILTKDPTIRSKETALIRAISREE